MTYTLRITDGTVTADMSGGLGGAARYAVSAPGWVPGIATQRASLLGGAGPYGEVVEEIPAMVLGATPAETLVNLAVLSQLFDQAERWNKGAPVAAVRVQYQPEGGSQLLQAAILGRAGTDTALILPPTFHQELGAWIIDSVRLRFRRRGLWLGTVNTPATSAGVANPDVMSVTFAAHQAVASPTNVTVSTGLSSTAALDQFLLIADAAAKIQFIGGADLATGGDARWDPVDDSANYARGDYVATLTPTDTTLVVTAYVSTTLPAGCRRVAVFAALRNNDASATFRVRALVKGIVDVYRLPEVPVDASSTDPRLVFLGMVSLAEVPTKFALEAAASTSTGPPLLDVNYVALLDITDEGARAIALPNVTADMALKVFPRPLEAPAPIAYHQQAFGQAPASYLGDAWISTTGAVLAVAWLALDPATAYWCYVSGGAAKTTTLTGSRYPAFLTPQ